jgi:hypothetical protein
MEKNRFSHLPPATDLFRCPENIAQAGLIGPKTGWKPIVRWVSSACGYRYFFFKPDYLLMADSLL